MVEAEADQIVRDAIAMQAYEESRHAELFASLMKHYAIAVPDPVGYTRGPSGDSCGWDMARCSISFFAFGLFKLAAEVGFFPDSLTQIFEKLISEEARHIIFFSNWAMYDAANARLIAKPWFSIRRAAPRAVQAFGRAHIVLGIATGAEPTSKRRTRSLSRPQPSGR